VARRKRGLVFLGIDVQRALVRLVANTVAILLAAKVISGIELDDWHGAVLAGAIFGLVNTFIKPIVKGLTCPFYLLTMGLFALVVNTLMLLLTSWIAQQIGAGFKVSSIGAAFIGAIVIGLIAWLVALVLPDD
jgi:putative membrane protein